MNALKLKTPNLPSATSFQDQSSEAQYLEALTRLQSDLTRETIDMIIKSLHDLLKKEPKSARVLAALSQAYFHKAQRNNDFDAAREAVQFAEQAMKEEAQSIEVQLASGQALLFLGKCQTALVNFRSVQEKQPSNLEAILGLAQSYEACYQLSEAEDYYRSAVTHWPGYWGSHNELGAFYFDQARYDEALREWEFVMHLNPDSAGGSINVGNALFKLGQYAPAATYFRQALDKLGANQETNENAYIGWGTAQFYLEKYEEAADAFNAGLKLNAKSPTLWANLGDALHQMTGQEAKAFDAYKEAIALARRNQSEAIGLARLAEMYAKRSQIDLGKEDVSLADRQTALALMRQALKDTPEDVEVLLSSILVYHLTNDHKRTMAAVEAALKNKLPLSELQNAPELKTLRLQADYITVINNHRKLP